MSRTSDMAGFERGVVAISGMAVAVALLGVGDAVTTYAGLGGWLAVSACTAAAVGAVLSALQGRWSRTGIAALWLAMCIAPWAAATYHGPIGLYWWFAMTGSTTWCKAVGAALVGASLLLAQRRAPGAASRGIALVGKALVVIDVVVVSREAAQVPLPGIGAMDLLAQAGQDGDIAWGWKSGWMVAGPSGPWFDPDGIASLGSAVAFLVGLIVAGLVVFAGRRRLAWLAWGAFLLAFVWPFVVPEVCGLLERPDWWSVAWTALTAVCSGAVSLVLLASATAAAVERASTGRTRRAQATEPDVVALEDEAVG